MGPSSLIQVNPEMQKEEIQIDLDFEIDPIKLEPSLQKDLTPCDMEDGEILVEEPEQILETEQNCLITDDLAEFSRRGDHSEENSRKIFHRQNYPERILYSRTLFVGDLPKKATVEKLSSIFDKYGKIIDIDIKYLKFGITTYAFIQFIDPICSISAHDNEQNCSIDGYTLKVGFGRATPSDCLWIGGLSENDLTEFVKTLSSFAGYICALTDTHLLQAIVKFEFLNECVVAYEHAFTLKKYPKLLVDFVSYHGAKKFIQRMLDSDQNVDDSHHKFFHCTSWSNRLIISTQKRFKHDYDNYPEEQNVDDFKRKNYGKRDWRHRGNDDRREQNNVDRSCSMSPLTLDSPRRKRRIPCRSTHSSEGSDDSKPSKSSSSENISKIGHRRMKSGLSASTSSFHKIWTGQLFLKSKFIQVSFVFMRGNRRVFDACLCDITKGKEKICSLKIGQRMKLDDEQLLLISQRLKTEEDTAFALALADDQNIEDKKSMKTNFIEYFSEKNAAGVVHILDSKHNDMTHVLYVFPTCTFTDKYTRDINKDLQSLIEKDPFLLILAVRCH